LVLKGIQVDDDPVEGGSFGDVYKGRLGNQDIALKGPESLSNDGYE
jgi:hypothetical protein